jgi:hypothetical protein
MIFLARISLGFWLLLEDLSTDEPVTFWKVGQFLGDVD